jgi:hypothetical protein
MNIGEHCQKHGRGRTKRRREEKSKGERRTGIS